MGAQWQDSLAREGQVPARLAGPRVAHPSGSRPSEKGTSHPPPPRG